MSHKAFERLLELELVKYLDGHPGKGTKEHRMMKSMMTRDEIQEAVMEFARDLPDAVMKWWGILSLSRSSLVLNSHLPIMYTGPSHNSLHLGGATH